MHNSHPSGLPPVCTVEHVMARYHLRDRRAARRRMDDTDRSFDWNGVLAIRREDLLAHEESLIASRQRANGAASPAQGSTGPMPAPKRGTRPHARGTARSRASSPAPLPISLSDFVSGPS
ncbi:MAG: hypothetical protein QOD86_2757 [Miltoncostaeaceae bacterium]|jgi:hypothetical protein|nr:hypothetical protein [Miltoncostaeaceae bacterium]